MQIQITSQRFPDFGDVTVRGLGKEVAVTFTLEQAMKAQRGSIGITVLFL